MDKNLRESFAKSNVQIFVGAGLSQGLYPDADTLKNILLKEKLYHEGEMTTLRKVLDGTADISSENIPPKGFMIKRQPR